MRRIIRQLMIATPLLVGAILALAGPAAAAPAQPYNYGPECDSDIFGADQICFSGTGVIQENVSASGNTLYHASGINTYEVWLDGVVIDSVPTRFG
jgi:hypothetical protein